MGEELGHGEVLLRRLPPSTSPVATGTGPCQGGTCFCRQICRQQLRGQVTKLILRKLFTTTREVTLEKPLPSLRRFHIQAGRRDALIDKR